MNSEAAKGTKKEANTLSEHGREFALEQHRRFEPMLDSADRSDFEHLALMLLQKRSVDGLNGRHWDAGAHLYFEDAVGAILRRLEGKK
jgi:hypothetical protein